MTKLCELILVAAAISSAREYVAHDDVHFGGWNAELRKRRANELFVRTQFECLGPRRTRRGAQCKPGYQNQDDCDKREGAPVGAMQATFDLLPSGTRVKDG